MGFWNRWQQIIKALSFRRIEGSVEINNSIRTESRINGPVEVYALHIDDEPSAKLCKIDNNSSSVVSENPDRLSIVIQNVGLFPCLIRLGNNVSPEEFNFVLAADTSPKQGNGGSVELKEWSGPIKAMCEQGETILAVTNLVRIRR